MPTEQEVFDDLEQAIIDTNRSNDDQILVFKNDENTPVTLRDGSVVDSLDARVKRFAGGGGGGGNYTLHYFKPNIRYPLNAEIMLDNGDVVKSTIENNTTNPNVTMLGWIKTNSASQIFDENRNSLQSIVDLSNKKFYSVLEEGASLTALESENNDAIRRAIEKAQLTNGVVWFPQLTSEFQDGVVPSGFKFNEQINFPSKVSVKMDTPLIWTGDSNTTPLIYGQALPANKSQFSEYVQVDVWLYNQNVADWGNDKNIGVWMYPHQFCRINLKVVQGFECGIVLNADKQGFVYNHIFIDELRGNRISMKWKVTNSGWFNENTLYKGRLSSNSAPSGKGAMSRYGIVAETDRFTIENNYWLNPCFELGADETTTESIPIVMNNSSGNTFTRIRAEAHKEWIARFTGASTSNVITSDYGRISTSVATNNGGRDWVAIDDQTAYKDNYFMTSGFEGLFYKAFSKIRIDEFKRRFYGLDAGYGAIQGLGVASASITYPAQMTYTKGGYGDTVDEDGGIKFGSASSRRVFRVKTNGARKIVVKQSGVITNLAVKTLDSTKELLYSTTIQYAKELNVHGSGGNAAPSFGGCYAFNAPLHGVSIIGLLSDVEYVDILIGGNIANTIYSVEVSTPDFTQLEHIPLFDNKSHSSKPTVVANVVDTTTVINSAYTGTGVYAWIFVGGAWRDLT